jgi:tRNA threonylcarbamoyladenosine biosynthesis protein TsaB
MLLAIETSGRVGGVAAADETDGSILAVRRLGGSPRDQAAELLPAVDALCRGLGKGPGDIGVVAVSVGPGGFTGLRIGVTFAKSFALATGARVVAVPSLDVLAANTPADAEHSAVVLDAKRGEIFTAVFRRTPAGIDKVWAECVCRPAEMLVAAGRPLLLLGEGLRVHADALRGEGLFHAPEDLWNADPAVTARMGLQAAARGEFADADRLVPVYLRRPEAEEVWAKRYGEGA